MIPVKEVCVESFDEARRAVAAGATRIELCENLTVGGTTPSFGTIKKCLKELTVPIMVMIRPRGGNFCYSPDELEIMEEDIRQCKKLGAAGVVFGLLDAAGKIDGEGTRRLVALAKPMQVTFHKAIDQTADLLESLETLKKTGIDRILTSGGKPTALEGRETLNQMTKLAAPRIAIIVAGKVTHENWAEVQQEIPAGEYHGRRLVDF